MFAIDEAKLPPPTPAMMHSASIVSLEMPGSSRKNVAIVGISSSAAEMIVQLRPPNFATANVYGSRRSAPQAAAVEVKRNLSAGVKPYCGPRKSTRVAHIVHTEKPMCSEKIENQRFLRAIFEPFSAQNFSSSGSHSSSQCFRALGAR